MDIVNHVLEQAAMAIRATVLPEGLELIPVPISRFILNNLFHLPKPQYQVLCSLWRLCTFSWESQAHAHHWQCNPYCSYGDIYPHGMANPTLNIMTLGGLALGVGMLVDNAIVMMENIYRHQRVGENAQAAAESASAEVTSALLLLHHHQSGSRSSFYSFQALRTDFSRTYFNDLSCNSSFIDYCNDLWCSHWPPKWVAFYPVKEIAHHWQRIDSLTDRAQSAYASVLANLPVPPSYCPDILGRPSLVRNFPLLRKRVYFVQTG